VRAIEYEGVICFNALIHRKKVSPHFFERRGVFHPASRTRWIEGCCLGILQEVFEGDEFHG
jgi:hypothetical protein